MYSGGGWVSSPGIKGVDRPWLRYRNGMWTITYCGKVMKMREGIGLKQTFRFAVFMVNPGATFYRLREDTVQKAR